MKPPVKSSQPFLYLLIFFTFTSLYFWGCTERERSNPFEPGETDEVISLTLLPESDKITLRWQLNRQVEDITGFRVYRSIGSPENLLGFQEVSQTTTQFTDFQVQPGQRYYYRVSVLGTNVESTPSNVESTLIGNGKWWVLTTDDRNVKLLSYDLQHTLRDYRTEFLSENWATPTSGDSLFWFSTPTYLKSIVSLNRQNGRERFFYFDSLSKAEDLFFNVNERQLYVLDNVRKRLFVLFNNNLIGITKLDENRDYRRIKQSAASDAVWVMSDQAISRYEINAGVARLTADWPFDSGFTGRDIAVLGGNVYALSAGTTASQLLQIDNQNNTTPISLQGRYRRVTVIGPDAIFLAQEIDGSDDALVKMNAAGQEIFRKAEFGSIEAIGVNPSDQTIVVADVSRSIVSLHDPQGNRISESRNSAGTRILSEPLKLLLD